jgi:HlyD family secretion protein
VLPRLLRRPSVWIIAALVVGAAIVFALRARGPLVRVTSPVRRDLEQHLVASGRVRVPQRVQVAAQTGGLVVVVGAVEGQRVQPGDLLIQLDDSAERAVVAQADAAVRQAKARVDQLKRVGAIVASEGLRQAESNLTRAETALSRAEALVGQGAAPAAELDDARRAAEVARAQRTAAEAQQLAAAPLGADSRVALTALLQAQAQLEGARVRLAQTLIVARDAGTILVRSIEPGDVAQPSQALLVMAVDAAVQLEFQPDERDLAWLQLGQPARAAADAYPQQGFDAKVAYIAPSVDPVRGSVEVRLDVPTPPPVLKPDMTVSIDLTVARKAGALVVPSEVVRGIATATPWVLVVEGGRVARREVQVGIRGEGSVEILGGLAEDAAVILPGAAALEPGARVRTER